MCVDIYINVLHIHTHYTHSNTHAHTHYIHLYVGEYVETVAGGLGANSEPPIDRMYDLATEDKSGVDDGTLSRVLLWATVILVIVGGIVLLGYNLLPPGSFSVTNSQESST